MRALAIILLTAGCLFTSKPALGQKWTDQGTAEDGSAIRISLPPTESPNNPDWLIVDVALSYPSTRDMADGRQYRARLYHLEIRCAERLARVTSMIYFEEPELIHEVQWIRVFSDWTSPDEGRVFTIAYLKACS